MKFVIPRSFKLFGQTINVKYDPVLLHDSDHVGQTRMRDNEIRLLPTSKENPYLESKIEQCFCHEITHIILDLLSERELSSNEAFVDRFAYALHQALTTFEGDINK